MDKPALLKKFEYGLLALTLIVVSWQLYVKLKTDFTKKA